MKRHLILPAIGLAGIAGLMIAASAQALPLPAATATGTATPSPSPSVSPSPDPEPSITPSPDPEPEGDVTVDIRIEMDLPDYGSDGPLVYEVTGVPVTDAIELDNPMPTSNPSDWGGTAEVDVAADLSGITISGGDDPNFFEEVYVIVTLHGAEWGDVSLGSDNLFIENAPVAFHGESFGGAGKGALSAGVHLAPVGNPPTLQFAGAEGSVFEAYWLGDTSSYMGGVASFAFTAPAAAPVEADPTFTG